MDLEMLFSAAGAVAAVGWLLLVAVPLKYEWPRTVAFVVAVGLACLYAALIGVYFTRADGGFGSLADVARLFASPGVLLAGWIHYLAFDLLVGRWQRDEARRLRVPQWLLVPCLVLTFLLGPIGWLCFLAVRNYRQRVVLVPTI